MISKESIERVKVEANIVEVVAETVALRRSGMMYTGLCPFHSERTPSFFVRETTNSYTCFGCGASGNAISFVMATRAMTFPDAVEYLGSRFGIEIKRDQLRASGPPVDRERLFALLREAFLFFRRSLAEVKSGEGERGKVRHYLQSRGLSAAAINSFGIGFSPSRRGALIEALAKVGFDTELMLSSGLVRRSASGDLYELFRGRLIFPIFVDTKRIAGFGGRLIPGVFEPSFEAQAPKYINSPETPIYQKSKTFYGLPQAMSAIRSAGEVYVVEGYMDVIGLAMKGVHNVVACCGTAMTEHHVKRLKGICSKVFLLFDGDAAGKAAAAKGFLPMRNAELDVEACFLPEGMDPDDFAKKHPGDLPDALTQVPRFQLVDVFVEGILARNGCAEGERPGPNLLGAVAEEVSKAIAGIEREIVRSAQISRVSRRLGVDAVLLTRAVNAARASDHNSDNGGRTARRDDAGRDARQDAATVARARGVVETHPSPVREIRKIADLPILDRAVVSAVMVLKEEILPDILNNPELCEKLRSESLSFLDALAGVLNDSQRSQEQRKEGVKKLLKGMEGPWLQLWKESYSALSHGKDARGEYMGVLSKLTIDRLQSELVSLRQAFADESLSEDRQRGLSARIVQVKRNLEVLQSGGRPDAVK